MPTSVKIVEPSWRGLIPGRMHGGERCAFNGVPNSCCSRSPLMSQDHNQQTYCRRGIVHHYRQLRELQPAEKTVLDRFQPYWSEIRMLDMGVGGGRTTQHFSNRVLEYVGIDYSAEMIAACQNRYSTRLPTVTFDVCDARDMSRFPDRSFDFILFSFNGIDYVSHGDRLRILQEVNRIGKPGGHFFFSSHNLQAMRRQFRWQQHLHLNPVTTYVNLVMLALLRVFNYPLTLDQVNTCNHILIKDESHNFCLNTYYITPEEQIKQLEKGFRDIQIFSWKSGLELKTVDEFNSSTDLWLYYLCAIE